MKTLSTTPRRWRLTADTVPYVLLAPFVILFLVFGLFIVPRLSIVGALCRFGQHEICRLGEFRFRAGR
jgi:hypothetical protein